MVTVESIRETGNLDRVINPYQDRRNRMVREDIARSAADGRIAVKDSAALRAILKVPRHLFISPELIDEAYDDRPLPIGYGQTISQPYIVAFMTELLKVSKNDKVLEVGTGSGYQTAILAEIVKEVCTIEIIKDLGEIATTRFKQLAYNNIIVKLGDGYLGWKEHAPYDAIMVTAALDHVPPAFVEQLKVGGRMVIPIGPAPQMQALTLIVKKDNATIVQEKVMPARFVPLTGRH